LKAKTKICKWYTLCPIKYYVENGKLDIKWIEEYYLIGNKDCFRYKMEEDRIHHPNNMLPNGEINQDLHF